MPISFHFYSQKTLEKFVEKRLVTGYRFIDISIFLFQAFNNYEPIMYHFCFISVRKSRQESFYRNVPKRLSFVSNTFVTSFQRIQTPITYHFCLISTHETLTGKFLPQPLERPHNRKVNKLLVPVIIFR